MKYIITVNEDNRIMHISKTIGHETNGNIILDNGTQIACIDEVTVYEVENVPENVVAERYCYTEEQGFYESANYKEPEKPLEERVNLIEERVALAEDMINMTLGF